MSQKLVGINEEQDHQFYFKRVMAKGGQIQTLKHEKPFMPSKWAFKEENGQDRSIRFKNRTVSRGYIQVYGIDYKEKILFTSGKLIISKNGNWFIYIIKINGFVRSLI